jgi:hypothetical protein
MAWKTADFTPLNPAYNWVFGGKKSCYPQYGKGMSTFLSGVHPGYPSGGMDKQCRHEE